MISLRINGRTETIDRARGDVPLLWALRDILGLTGTKFGCASRSAAPCTVHLDSVAVRSCLLPIGSIGDRAVYDHRGGRRNAGRKQDPASLARPRSRAMRLLPVRQIMSAAALLAATPNPDDSDIDAAMAGNICRCGTYVRIRAAIKHAAGSDRA